MLLNPLRKCQQLPQMLAWLNLAELLPAPVKSGHLAACEAVMVVPFAAAEAVARKRMRMLVSLVQSRLHLSEASLANVRDAGWEQWSQHPKLQPINVIRFKLR